MTIGERIKIRRTGLGLTQPQLAEKIGITKNAVSGWERNENNPSAANLLAIAKILGVELNWLAYGEGTMDVPESEAVPISSKLKLIAGSELKETQHIKDDHPDPSTISEAKGKDMRKFDLAASNMNEIPVKRVVMASTFAGAPKHSVDAFNIDSTPIDRVPCPTNLLGTLDLYAIFVGGRSMTPEHRPGALRFVAPHRPIDVGDTIVFEFKSADAAVTQWHIKIFRGHKDGKMIVSQHNPHFDIGYSESSIGEIHKVLTLNEIFGFS